VVIEENNALNKEEVVIEVVIADRPLILIRVTHFTALETEEIRIDSKYQTNDPMIQTRTEVYIISIICSLS
jgi:hypothetical protein